MKKSPTSRFRKKRSDSSTEDKEPLTSGYAKYTNIIYVLIGSIAFGFAAGYFLDKFLNLSFPVFKVICSFGGVILALYLVFKELNRK